MLRIKEKITIPPARVGQPGAFRQVAMAAMMDPSAARSQRTHDSDTDGSETYVAGQHGRLVAHLGRCGQPPGNQKAGEVSDPVDDKQEAEDDSHRNLQPSG